MPPSFARRKAAILAQLALPDEEYADLSPKGTVDAGIRELIGEINAREGLVTTSSCAGRVSVFLEGRRRPQGLSDSNGVDAGDDGDQRLPGHLFAVDEEGAEEERGHDGGSGSVGVGTVAGVGGKGGGGRWLFVSHDPVETNGKLDSEPNIVAALLGMDEPIFDGREDSLAEQMSGGSARLIHFKFEPMVCYISLVCIRPTPLSAPRPVCALSGLISVGFSLSPNPSWGVGGGNFCKFLTSFVSVPSVC